MASNKPKRRKARRPNYYDRMVRLFNVTDDYQEQLTAIMEQLKQIEIELGHMRSHDDHFSSALSELVRKRDE